MMALSTLSHGIQGGTEQNQRNIVGERTSTSPRNRRSIGTCRSVS